MYAPALLLDCLVECPCTDSGCLKNHARRWVSNYEFLHKYGILGWVKELRIVLFNVSPKELRLDKTIENLCIPKGAIASTQMIMFLGPGLYLAGRTQESYLAKGEGARTARLIIEHCPRAAGLWFHYPDEWCRTHGLIRDAPGVGHEIMMLLRSELHSQLTRLQIARPFPPNLSKPFAKNFEVLDIDIGLLSELKLLPKIPIAFLRDLALYDIKRQIDWDMFEASPDGEMVFKRLEEIFLQFDDGHATDGHFVADRYNVTFPKATVVKAARTLNTGMAIDNYLRGGQRKILVLYEDPHMFATQNLTILRCATYVRIQYVDGRRGQSIAYRSHGMYKLYRHRNKWIRGLRLVGINYPMPVKMNWISLRWLHIEVSIADAKSIINLICQLKELETLVVDCFSMTRGHIRAPDRDEHFANQAGSFRDIDEAFRKVPKEIGAKLTRLDIRSRKDLCVDSVSHLVDKLPDLLVLGVSQEAVKNAPLWVGSRGIHVREFSTHIEELDKELGN